MRHLVTMVLLGTGCQAPSHFETIVVDIAANCNEVEVTSDAVDLDPRDGSGLRVLAAAHDGASTSGWWLLVSAPEGENEPHSLQLWHLLDGSVDARVPLGLAPDVAPDLDLRPGVRPGEAWLLRRAEGLMYVWQVDADASEPLVGMSSDLGAFPVTNDLCQDNEFGFETRCPTTTWHRDLVFLDGVPFVASVPPFSSDASTWVYLGELVHGATAHLFVLQERPLEFVSRCDPGLSLQDFATCEERLKFTSYPDIRVLATQIDPRTPFTSLLVLRERAEDNVPSPYPEVVVLSLGLTDSNLAGGLVKADSGIAVPTGSEPTGLALDAFATYLLHATHDRGPLLLRMPNLGATVEPITDVPLGGEVALLQLDDDVALSRIVDGTWEITKLFPDAPEQSRVTEHRAATPIVAVEPAGPGAFIAFREGGGPDLLRVRCLDRD